MPSITSVAFICYFVGFSGYCPKVLSILTGRRQETRAEVPSRRGGELNDGLFPPSRMRGNPTPGRAVSPANQDEKEPILLTEERRGRGRVRAWRAIPPTHSGQRDLQRLVLLLPLHAQLEQVGGLCRLGGARQHHTVCGGRTRRWGRKPAPHPAFPFIPSLEQKPPQGPPPCPPLTNDVRHSKL